MPVILTPPQDWDAWLVAPRAAAGPLERSLQDGPLITAQAPRSKSIRKPLRQGVFIGQLVKWQMATRQTGMRAATRTLALARIGTPRLAGG